MVRALHAATWLCLGLSTLAVVAVTPCRGHNHEIHKRMSVDDLRRLFQVERHDEVPEYEVVRVRSRLPARGDLAGGGGGGTRTTTTTTSTPAPEDSGGRPAGTAGAGPGAEPGAAVDVSRIVELSAFGRQHQLRLRPAHGLLNKELKVFVADHANGTDVDYTELHHEGEHIGEIFQDEDSEAAILLHRDPDGSYLLDGTIGDDLVVKPVPASVRQHLGAPAKHLDPDDEMFLDQQEDVSEDEVVRGFPLGKDSNSDVRFEDGPGPGRRRLRRSPEPRVEHHAHIVYKRAGSEAAEAHPDLSDYAFMEPDALPVRGSRSRRSIVKREAPYVIYPEILVIVDYDGYRLHGGDNVQIKRYFVSFWNGVDLRYKLLKGPRIRISIAGIIISRGRDATPYLERNRVGRDAIDSAAALTDMGKYLFRERRLPVYDIAVAVTKYDMCRRRKGGRCTKGTAGFAYVGGACVVNKRLEKVNSVAIIEDTGGFSGIIVAAHEVGHLLGAVHDGSPPPSYLGGPGAEKCRWEDGYIMSDLRHTEKGFKWSPCTVSSFHHFLNGDTATCLYNSPHEDESLPRVLPGKLLTLDAQCRKDRGTSACFKDDRVCAQLFCFDSGSGYCVAYRPAAEGSPCGDGQYCMNGKCVVEHENIIPDYSQNAPAFLRRIDDDGSATQPRPYYTYNITTQRSDWAEFWNDRLNDITTTPNPDTTKSYITYSYSTSYDTTQQNKGQNHETGKIIGHNEESYYKSSLPLDDGQKSTLITLKENDPATANPQRNDQIDLYNVNNRSDSYHNNEIIQKPTTQSNLFHTFSTTRSPYDFSDFGKSTDHNSQFSQTRSAGHNQDATVRPNLYEDYYKTSTTKHNLYHEYYRTSTSKSNLYDEYYRTSTTKQNLYDYYKTTNPSEKIYQDYYKTSTEAPNSNVEYYRTSSIIPNTYEEYYRTSSTLAPYTTTKNPYDFSIFGQPRQNYKAPDNKYYSSTTDVHDPYQIQSTTENPYAAYELYYKTSTTTRPYYQSSGTSNYENHAPAGGHSPESSYPNSLNPQPSSAPQYLDSSTKPVAGTDECVDVAHSISGGLTCREFLERYGFQYCNYHSMRKSCCASQREVCPTSR